jgi:hypothetical protein
MERADVMAAAYYLALGMVYLGWRIERKRKSIARYTDDDRRRLWIVAPALVLFWPITLAAWAALKIKRRMK